MHAQLTTAEQLASVLEENAPDLVKLSVTAMYRNPFWEARFGQRGRDRAAEDANYHIKYLASALRLEQPGVMMAYARWLQNLLTVRGMCSRHVEENFQRLGDAMVEIGIADAALATPYLAAGEDGLLYSNGPPREIQQSAARLASQIAQDLAVRHPEWYDQWRPGSHERCEDDARYHLSYLADALAAAAPGRFVAYVSWVNDFPAKDDAPFAHARETLEALEGTLTSLSAETAKAARPLTQTARSAVAEVA